MMKNKSFCVWMANTYDNLDDYCMSRNWTWSSLPLRFAVNFLFFATGVFILTLPFVCAGRDEIERQRQQEADAKEHEQYIDYLMARARQRERIEAMQAIDSAFEEDLEELEELHNFDFGESNNSSKCEPINWKREGF